MTDMLQDFLIESAEGIDLIDHHLVALEEEPGDEQRLTEVFRAFHTLKSGCGFYGFDQLESLAHSAENLLTLLRSGEMTFDSAVANALLAVVDLTRRILAVIERTRGEGDVDVSLVIARLDALADGGAAEVDTSWDTVEGGGETATRIGDRLVDNGDAERQDVELAAAQQGLGDNRLIGQILVDQGETSPDAVAVAMSSPSVTDSTIRVDVGLLDSLMNLVGELVLSRNELLRLATDHDDKVFLPPSQRLNLITSELQEGIMKTRMQPINSAWSKLPRLARDLSQQLGKQVKVEMIGRETELDRTIIEAIRDPLTHIVRNTIDHGIESPDERLAAGKAASGTLTLEAGHRGEQVNIEISDDGRGIDPDRIREVAVERGLLSRQEVDHLTDTEAIQLIFQPGFSTAEEVTNVSGRGVGMDVVKASIERIGGSIDLSTEIGRGTTLSVKIPLTLAIIPALTIRIGDSRYAIPQVNVLELVRLGPGGGDRIEDLHGAAVYRLRGRLLPLVDLREQLGLEPIETRATNIAVVQTDTLRFGLVVDGIDDNGEIVVKPLTQQVKDMRLFSGATILGDGTVALILDLLGLAERAGLAAGSQTMSEIDRQSALAGDAQAAAATEALIVLSVGECEQVAVPLDEIDRLEEIPVESIERSEGRPVVQYRNSLMPMVDLGQVIGLGGSAMTDKQRINCVVCLAGERTVGLAVDEILDIVHSDAVRPSGQPGTVIVDGRVTDLVSPDTVIAAAFPALATAADHGPIVDVDIDDDWLPAGPE